MSNLKVLPLMAWQHTIQHPTLKEIRTLAERDGYYMRGSYCWFETQGRAFESDPKQFDLSLRYFTQIPYSETELEALKKIPPKYLSRLGMQLLLQDRWHQNTRDRLFTLFRIRKMMGLIPTKEAA